MSTLAAQSEKSAPNVWISGLLGGVLAFTGSLVIYGIARLLGIPLQVAAGPPGQSLPLPLGVGPIFLAVLVPTLAATALYALLRRFFEPRANLLFQLIVLAVLLLSLGGPLSLPVSAANHIVLVLMHLVSAGAIVWALTLRK